MSKKTLPPFSILRAAHAEITVSDFERAKRFYVDALGLLETGRDKDRVYLGGLEETDKYSLVLRKGRGGTASHISFKVAGEDDLAQLRQSCVAAKLPVRDFAPGETEQGQGSAFRTYDPNGMPVEFFAAIEKRERKLQQFDAYRGACIMRIDHFNIMVPDVQKSFDWWTQSLGFRCSEYTVTEGSEKIAEQLWAAWLFRKPSVHDLALTNGAGPRLHHVGVWAADTQSILRVCDVLASMGLGECIERGPGRHGISNAFFLYLRDPDGNRIEIYTGDYLTVDPDVEPKKWHLNDARRATFWGHKPPKSWFEEASPVEDIETGELIGTSAGKLTGKPEFVT